MLMNNLLQRLEEHSSNLELLVAQRTAGYLQQKHKVDIYNLFAHLSPKKTRGRPMMRPQSIKVYIYIVYIYIKVLYTYTVAIESSHGTRSFNSF